MTIWQAMFLALLGACVASAAAGGVKDGFEGALAAGICTFVVGGFLILVGVIFALLGRI